MSNLNLVEFERLLSSDRDALDVHLTSVEHEVEVKGCSVALHCHCMAVDANGKVRPKRLAEFMRDSALDYAIPKSRAQEARERDVRNRNSRATLALHGEAIGLFTDLLKSGEGGELLLYLLAEYHLGIPQILSKMSLKTDSRMHYHGADGVYAMPTESGTLKLFWGESKVFGNPADAIRECLRSLSPFLAQGDSEDAEREKDLLLLRDHADLDDEKLTAALRKRFDKSSKLSNTVEYCGIALVGFDADFYPASDARGLAEDVVSAAKTELEKWGEAVGRNLAAEKLERFDIRFLCVPLPSVDGFRGAFREALGFEE